MFAQWWCRDVLSKTKPSFLRFHTTSMRSISQQVRVRLLPSPRCFFDEPVHVKVDGLSPHQKVGLRSKLRDDKGIIFRASALYSADSKGQVDLCLSPSLGGSYTGVEPMGLFWAMTPETPHSRLLKNNVLGSIMVDVDALHEDTGEILASKTNERQFMTEGMRRIPLGLKNGRIRGTLFLPPGPGPFPGILDVYTLGGGISEVRASLLANKGFVVLALGYYGFQDLPKTMSKNLDLEYFEEAITFLRRQPQVQGPGIGILSISKSGELALSMASFLSGVSATAWINGCNANVMIPLHYKDLVIPPLMPVLENITLTPSSLLNIRDTIPAQTTERNRGSVIPIERSGSRFLFAASEDDMNWNSCLFAQQAAAQLRHHGKENFEVVTYPRAGHFLEVPYMPHYPSGFHAVLGKVVVFGGEAKANHEAQLDLWRRVQEFFRTHLKDSSNTAQKAKARL
ncbi:acyl-coenzyme A thioesterase 1-like [Coregonus clupeaformis]|uniref:acyl-coenzyme A thioesterase 1-like n=1 Tax=Coregonus clupeaformis TaxID=59861 RepID=UPI001BE00FCB|nr:acyl-coenzyme A thioesterase 1-like [Coregonus clupeaformis]